MCCLFSDTPDGVNLICHIFHCYTIWSVIKAAPPHLFPLSPDPQWGARPGVMVVPACHSPGGRRLHHVGLHLSPQRPCCLENTDSTESLRLSITVWRQWATAWIGRGGQRGQRFLGSSVQIQTSMGNMVMAAYRGRNQGQWLNKLLNLFPHWCLKASTFSFLGAWILQYCPS